MRSLRLLSRRGKEPGTFRIFYVNQSFVYRLSGSNPSPSSTSNATGTLAALVPVSFLPPSLSRSSSLKAGHRSRFRPAVRAPQQRKFSRKGWRKVASPGILGSRAERPVPVGPSRVGSTKTGTCHACTAPREHHNYGTLWVVFGARVAEPSVTLVYQRNTRLDSRRKHDRRTENAGERRCADQRSPLYRPSRPANRGALFADVASSARTHKP